MAFTPVTFLGGGDGDGGRNQEVGKTGKNKMFQFCIELKPDNIPGV